MYTCLAGDSASAEGADQRTGNSLTRLCTHPLLRACVLGFVGVFALTASGVALLKGVSAPINRFVQGDANSVGMATRASIPEVYYDGVHPIPVPRSTHSGEFASEFLHVIPAASLKKVNAVVNSSHVILAFSSELIDAGFARYHNTLGNSAAGVARLQLVYTPFSFFPGTVFMFAEKDHILVHEGIWETTSANASAEFAAPPYDSPFGPDSSEEFKRNEMVYNSPSTIAAGQITAAGFDPTLNTFAREKFESGHTVDLAKTKYSALLAKARHAMGTTKTQPALSSDNGCFHFEPGNGVAYNKTHVTIPLNKPVMSYKGIINGLPNKYFDIFSGSATWSYRPSDGSVTIFHGSFGHMHFQDPEVRQTQDLTGTANFWVAPVDGVNTSPPPKDTRVKTAGVPSPGLKALRFTALQTWAPSTASLYQDTAHLCAKPKVRVGAVVAAEIETAIMSSPLDKLAPAWVPFVARTAACGNVYVRSSYKEGYNYFGAFELWFFKHFVLEADKTNLQAWWDAFTRRDWDDGIIVCPVGCRGSKQISHRLSDSSLGSHCPIGCFSQ